jgi:surface polysaccharide O-acyltransferase-like enzyme
LGILNSAVGRRNLIPVILFALVVAAVLAVIMDLDRTQQGLLNIVQGPLLELQRQMGAPGS